MKQVKVLNRDFIRFIKSRNIEEHDSLTKLPNRRAMYAHYVELPKNSVITVMFIDIDNFKRINDVYGHTVGDELLCVLAGYFCEKLPEADIFHAGGDEFIVFLKGEREDSDLLNTVSLISSDLSSIRFRREVLSLVSFSIGIVANQPITTGLDNILNRVDAALYHAKENGKNSCVMYKSLEEEEKRKKIIEDEMAAALSHNEFVPYLLPKINLKDGCVIGAEVLCRWNHWIDGLRMPLDFMTVFENNGFITTIDFYMFEEACKMKQTWTDTPMESLILSVNISTLNLSFSDLVDRLTEVADNYHVPHDQLEFEIPEAAFHECKGMVESTIKQMVSKGFLVSIDDFGSGSTTPALLADLPFQHVDFDRGFISSTTATERGKVILKNIVQLCKDMKLTTLAEGVETAEQIDALKNCGIDNAQGYFFSAPVPEEDFIKYALSHYMG